MASIDTLVRSLEDPNTDIQNTLAQIDKSHIKREGLTQKQLLFLFDLLLDPYSHFNASARSHILKNYIYFKEVLIPSEIIIRIFGRIGVKTIKNDLKRLPMNFQTQLVKWVICVYSFLEDSDIIEKLYGILFNYLELDFIRSLIAHLLFLATTKAHVTTERIDRLKNIYNKYGQPDSIAGLLLHYQSFAPDQVFDTFQRISNKIFAHPDFEYLQELLSLRSHGEQVVIQGAYDNIKYIEEFENRLKRRKRGPAREFTSSYQIAIPSLDKLVKNVESLDIKKNWGSLVFESKAYSSLAYAVKENENDIKRLNAWISSFLADDIESASETEINWGFEAVLRYVDTTGIVPEAVVDDLLLNPNSLKILKIQRYIFYLLSRLGITYNQRIMNIVQTIREVSLDMPVDWNCDFIDSLHQLFLNWYLQIDSSDVEEVLSLLFKEVVSKLEPVLYHFQYNKVLAVSIVNFINLLQKLPENYLTTQLVVLPESVIHSLIFLGDPFIFSSVCAHLNFAKNVLKTAEASDEITRLTNLHNSYVVDICNLIWRNKAFDPSKNGNTAFALTYEFINALKNSVPIYDSNSSFKTLFNIHTNPAFASYSREIITRMELEKNVKEKHEGPLTPQSVERAMTDNEGHWIGSYEDVRVEILKALEDTGYVGLSELLFSHLKSLVTKK